MGWAALTGLHAGESRDRLRDAGEILGPAAVEIGNDLIAAYRNGSKSGHDCALAVGEFVGSSVKRINSRHAELIKVREQLAGFFSQP